MKLTLIRLGQVFWVEDWQSWMEKPTTVTVLDNTPHKDANGKFVNTPLKKKKECFEKQPDGSAVFMAGLLDEFTLVAAKHGYEIEVIDKRDPNPLNLVPNYDNLDASFRYKQLDVVKEIEKHDKGIVTCSVGFGKSFCIKQICRLYPTAKIIVISTARSVVDQLYDNISQLLGKNEVGKLCSGTPIEENEKRVVITTTRSVYRADLEHCDIVMYDEVHSVGDNQVYDLLSQRCGNCRMYGFTASLSRTDKAEPLIKALFGVVIATCTYQEAAAHHMVTPITASFIHYEHNPIKKVTGFKVVDERIHYWQNWHRNKAIADLAVSLPQEAQSIITVAKLEHAICLKKHQQLKDWPIIHGGNVEAKEIIEKPHTFDTAPGEINVVSPNGEAITLTKWIGDATHIPGMLSEDLSTYVSFKELMNYIDAETGEKILQKIEKPNLIAGEPAVNYRLSTKQVRGLINDLKEGRIMHAIVTPVIKEGVDLHSLRILIRADGTASAVFNTQVPGRLSRLQEGKDNTFLFDVWDDDNPWVLFRTQQRLKTYKEKGWYAET